MLTSTTSRVFKPGQVWTTTDGSCVYVHNTKASGAFRNRATYVFASPIRDGAVLPVQFKWGPTDLVHLIEAWPIPVDQPVPVPVYLGRVQHPEAMGGEQA